VGEVITESGVNINPLLFHRENGSPVGNIRRSWATACKKAGIKKMLFHDLAEPPSGTWSALVSLKAWR